MRSRSRASPSLQSLIDTYRYLVSGSKSQPSPAIARDAAAAGRVRMVPAAVKRDLLQELQLLPNGLAVPGLSTASVRSGDSYFVMADAGYPPVNNEEIDLSTYALTSNDAGADHSSVLWHRWVYTHSDANAVLILHPVHAVMCAVQELVPDPTLFPLAAQKVGAVQVVASDPTGWNEETVKASVVLVQAGAMVSWDRSTQRAVEKAAIVARWCEVHYRRRCRPGATQ